MSDRLQSLKVKDEVYVSEEVDYFSDNDFSNYSFVPCPTPLELHEKYQAFLKANGSRNSSADWLDQNICYADDVHVVNTSDNACSSNDSDHSLQDYEVSELQKKNLSLRQRNRLLNSKNEELLRQVESLEEENEKQRNKEMEMEKELKNYSDTIRESAQVRVELDQALAELHKARGEQQSLEQEVQRLKSDEDESLQAMNRMRDQIDTLSTELSNANSDNKRMTSENSELKDRCAELRSYMLSKENELDQKENLCQEANIRAEEYLRSLQDLQEEKEALLNQIREVQLEVSIYQTYQNRQTEDCFPPKLQQSPSSRAGDLLSELTAADQNTDSTFYIFAGKNELRSPNSEREQIAQQAFDKAGSVRAYSANASVQLRLRGMKIQTQLEAVQSVRPNRTSSVNYLAVPTLSKAANASSQTVSPPVLSCSCQTSGEFIEKQEFEMLLTVQEHCTTLQSDLALRNSELEELRTDLAEGKKFRRHLIAQLEASRDANVKLESMCEKKNVENLHLTELFCKLCSGRLDSWYDEHHPEEVKGEVWEKLAGDAQHAKEDEPRKATTVDALYLESALPFVVDQVSTLHNSYSAERISDLIREVSLCVDNDLKTNSARYRALRQCRGVVMNALRHKIELLQTDLRTISDWQECKCDQWLKESRTERSRQMRGQLEAIDSIGAKLGNFLEPTLAVKNEAKYLPLIKILLSHIYSLNEKINRMNVSLIATTPLLASCSPPVEDCFPFVEDLGEVCDEVALPPAYDRLLGCIYPYQPRGCMKDLLSNNTIAEILLFILSTNRAVQSWMGKHRTSVLGLLFVLCTYLTIQPADRRHYPGPVL